MATRAKPDRCGGHRWFAATYDSLTQWSERKLMRHLRPLVAGAAMGQVLEIGVGTGANFAYYKGLEKIVATDPDPFMLRRAQKRAEELVLEVQLQQCPAEVLPFANASFDTVVATLVFCSVSDPSQALREVKRVLKPTGVFRFVEHVRANGGLIGQVQEFLTPVWHWFGAGCHLNRRTVTRIEVAGFQFIELEQRQLPLMPLIIGAAKAHEDMS